MDRYLVKVQSASAVIVRALPFLALPPSERRGVSLSIERDGHPDEGCNPLPLSVLSGRAGAQALKHWSQVPERKTVVVSCDCGSRVGGKDVDEPVGASGIDREGSGGFAGGRL